MKLIVGIDFGTSTTVVRYKMENSDVICSIKDDHGNSDIFPTVIYRYPETGVTVYAGEALVASRSGLDDHLIRNFKMDLLNPEKREETLQYITDYLRFIYERFQDQTKRLNPTSTEVYVSYPGKWDENMSQVMKDAVCAAGFQGTVKGVKEPEAAARNMLYDNLKELQRSRLLTTNSSLRILVLDMGAGTSDVSIFKLTIDEEGVPQITENQSYPSKTEKFLCGGKEIDEALHDYLKDYCNKEGLEYIDPECINLHDIKYWKETMVSDRLKDEALPVTILPVLSYFLKSKKRHDLIEKFSLDRADFEYITKKHWANLYNLIKSAMSQYKYAKPEDIDFVCLTGGHSAWYTVPKLFNGEGVCNSIAKEGKDPDALNFKKLKEDSWRFGVLKDVLPHESVARGLCLMDERMIYETPSSNNVWVRITINNEVGEIIQVVNKFEDILPVTKNVSQDVSFLREAVFGDFNFEMQAEIFEGETLEDAEFRVLKLNKDTGKFMNRLLAFLRNINPLNILNPLGILNPSFKNLKNIPVNVSMGITMNEEGLLEIDGKFTINNDTTLAFTYDDFKLIENK